MAVKFKHYRLSQSQTKEVAIGRNQSLEILPDDSMQLESVKVTTTVPTYATITEEKNLPISLVDDSIVAVNDSDKLLSSGQYKWAEIPSWSPQMQNLEIPLTFADPNDSSSTVYTKLCVNYLEGTDSYIRYIEGTAEGSGSNPSSINAYHYAPLLEGNGGWPEDGEHYIDVTEDQTVPSDFYKWAIDQKNLLPN